MDQIIGYCGLLCSGCKIYLATREKNKSKKQKMISEIICACRELYGVEYKPSDITPCDGCTSGARIFSPCKNCLIRNCAFEKQVKSCALCDMYPCEKLSDSFKSEPSARTRLDTIRNSN